jgi:hypothetical protein
MRKFRLRKKSPAPKKPALATPPAAQSAASKVPAVKS